MTGETSRDLADAVTVSLSDADTVSLSDQNSGRIVVATGTSEADLPGDGEPVGRYDIREEIARGGMGEVYLAIDQNLGRQVAVKILHSRYKAGSVAARRFVDEARISGQLQHPGIPPIHGLGTLPDGRPYLAMKLIKGRTLDDLLHDRPGPDADRGRFLAAFEQVCQAVAYAHARHVIHRDLKPQNIMVGAFGEVQVMDWGLAKVLGETTERGREIDSDEPLTTEIFQARDDSDGTETQAGSVLGTPAYMAPEQAIGAVEDVDKRSDVFGLGAVLAVILTGRPPFVGHTAEGTRVLAAGSELNDCFDRLATCGAEPDLVALCKLCLSPDRQARPADAGAIASAVAALRAEAETRARQAELDRVRAEGERARLEAETRAQRQKRRTQLALASGLVGLLVVVVAAWLTIRNQAEGRRADAERLASIALGRTMQLAIQARATDVVDLAQANVATMLWEQAAAAIEQAEEAIAGVDSPTLKLFVGEKATGIRTGLHNARREASLLAALDAAAAADSGTIGEHSDQRETVRAFRSAFEAAGLPAGGDAPTLAAAVRAERPGLRVALLRALDLWRSSLQYPPDPDANRVRATADLVDDDPIRKEIRDAVASKDKEALSRLAKRLADVDLDPTSAVMLGTAYFEEGFRREAIRILQKARERDPSNLILLMILGASLSAAAPDDPVVIEESVGCARAGVAAHPNQALSHYQLGQVFLFAKKDPAAAEIHYRKALEFNPRFLFGLINLGYCRQLQGDRADAERCYRQAATTDPQLLMAHKLLGETLQSKGDLAGAEAAYRKALELTADKLSARTYFQQQLTQIQRLAQLLPRLDDVLAGRTVPATPAEAIEFAMLCRQPFRNQHAGAVRLFDRAFIDDPKLADDLASANRYDAACSAALAGSGQGADAPIDPAARAALRQQSLAFLRTRLALKSKQAASDNPADRRLAAVGLTGWLDEEVLATVRPGSARFNLPDDERADWESFWADVRSTIETAQKPVPSAASSP